MWICIFSAWSRAKNSRAQRQQPVRQRRGDVVADQIEEAELAASKIELRATTAARSCPALREAQVDHGERGAHWLENSAAFKLSSCMKFCSACGQPVALKIPEGDHLPRYVCTACGDDPL